VADQPRWTQWPENCAPCNSPIYALNELHMSVPAHVAWEWLVRAPLWPGWYTNARHVSILEGADQQRLSAGTRFRWRTSNTLWRPVETTVDICEPPAKLGWGGAAMGSRGYHSWLFIPDGDGCHVVTEECQAGVLPSLGRRVLKRGLVKHHQRWLEGLERKAMEGPPS
jgi:polyketide cyclase/dehydrase/lipid transport protein